ncbi:signal peptidase I [Amycolatopsis sp. NBC_01488]|uniref:signal peptidase I n=1 Tax=Amycolatopsis sp. NBC_01488 TaxID=2903563 RepID=UPI002E28CC91|nr:signal peptidase I [Amycolatopsis sp. NBC_01488]
MTEFVFPPAPPEPPKRRRVSRVLVVWIVVTLLGFGAAAYGLGTVVFGYRSYRVPGSAMSPALEQGDSVIVRVLGGEEVHRGDVVMFDRSAYASPSQPGASIFRVVAVAGDTVACCTAGGLSVNGKAVAETYLSQGAYAHDPLATTPFDTRVHDGQVFVLGDQRGNADDSRFRGVVRTSGISGLVIATGTVFRPSPLARTSAFTDAGLPGAPFEDTTFSGLRWWLAGGVVVFAAGLVGVIVSAVRSAGRRRRAAAAPPVR